MTPSGAQTIAAADAISGTVSAAGSWTAPGRIDIAKMQGSCVVVACSNTLYCLHVDAATAAISMRGSATFAHQASALGVFTMSQSVPRPSSGGAAVEPLLVAVGHWMEKKVVLMHYAAPSAASASGPAELQEVCSIELEEQQPRSVACLAASGAWLLLVGTIDGRLLMWRLKPAVGVAAGAATWEATDGCALQISHVEVQLHVMAAAAGALPFVYAHAGHDVIIQPTAAAGPDAAMPPDAGSSPSSNAALPVRLSRVHGSEGLRAIVAVHTSAMAHSMAWVNRHNQLLFGALDRGHQLHWSTAFIGDTPRHVAYQAATNTFVVLTEGEDGRNCMRVVDAGVAGGSAEMLRVASSPYAATTYDPL